jgi:hypothetical protein
VVRLLKDRVPDPGAELVDERTATDGLELEMVAATGDGAVAPKLTLACSYRPTPMGVVPLKLGVGALTVAVPER